MRKFPFSTRSVRAGVCVSMCLCVSLAVIMFHGPLKRMAVAATLPGVSVNASDAFASEPGTDRGSFTVTRTLVTAKPLTVYYKVGGKAAAGTDYTALPGSVVIPAGAASAVVTVAPLDDSAAEGDETVTVTLISKSTYMVNTPASATVSTSSGVASQSRSSEETTDQ